MLLLLLVALRLMQFLVGDTKDDVNDKGIV